MAVYFAKQLIKLLETSYTTGTTTELPILRTKLARDRAVRAKFVEIRVRFNQGKV